MKRQERAAVSRVSWTMFAVLVGLFALLATACGGQTTPVPTAPGQGGQTPRPSEYNQLVEAARAEGQVVIVMGGSASRNFAPLFEDFRNETGVEVVAVTGRGSQQVEKLAEERAAGIFSSDIWMTGITSTDHARSEGIVGPLPEDMFILPEVADKSLWKDGQHWYADANTRNSTFVFCASPSSQFAYNTELVDISQLDSYWDLIDGRFQGKMIGTLPWEPGQTNSEFYINHPDLGEEFIRKMIVDAGVEWVVDGQVAVDELVNGVKSIIVYQGNANADIDELEEKGLPVKNHFGQGFAEGGVLSIGGSCSMSLINNAPHPNAAKLFFNWWNTKENLYKAQGITNDQSMRADLDNDNMLEQYRRDPNKEYFFPEMRDDIDQDAGLEFNRKVAAEHGLR